ncbi:MAG: hypothetical protein AAF433_14075 [Bacteroidota bacterium]
MNSSLKLLLIVGLITTVMTSEKICVHLGFGQAKQNDQPVTVTNEAEQSVTQETEPSNYLVNDFLYQWDEQFLDWVPVEGAIEYQAQLVSNDEPEYLGREPIKVEWESLMDINYQLRFFSELDMEIYAPVFPSSIQALDGKEVVIEGFVIPFDAEEELLSLSANPYASCFFCGQASPASVISMYLKNKRKRYKVDDFKKFRGTLHLNYDDPKEFYYILRDAEEE